MEARNENYNKQMLPNLDIEECVHEIKALAFMQLSCANSIEAGGIPSDDSSFYAFDMVSQRLNDIEDYLNKHIVNNMINTQGGFSMGSTTVKDMANNAYKKIEEAQSAVAEYRELVSAESEGIIIIDILLESMRHAKEAIRETDGR